MCATRTATSCAPSIDRLDLNNRVPVLTSVALNIRQVTTGTHEGRPGHDDWPGIWSVLEPVFREGHTYSFARDISEAEARHAWMVLPTRTFVCEDEHGSVVGTYYLKPNQPGQGSHVANAGYVVSPAARGLGAASAMCTHSQQQARAMGFRAMQFNFVVSTNEGAVRLWKRHGFDVVGTLPGAFAHPELGFVDALVMFKRLTAI